MLGVETAPSLTKKQREKGGGRSPAADFEKQNPKDLWAHPPPQRIYPPGVDEFGFRPVLADLGAGFGLVVAGLWAVLGQFWAVLTRSRRYLPRGAEIPLG